MREQRRQRRLVAHAVDARELIAQAVEAGRLHARLVHEGAIEIGELARLAALPALLVDALDRLAQLLLGGLVHREERVPGRTVGRDRGCRKPLAVGELPEIVLRPHRGIDRRQVDAGTRFRHNRRRAGRADRQSENECSQHRFRINSAHAISNRSGSQRSPRNAAPRMVAMHPAPLNTGENPCLWAGRARPARRALPGRGRGVCEPGPRTALYVCNRSSLRRPFAGPLARQPALSAAFHHRIVLGRQRHRRPPRRRAYSAGDAVVPALVAGVSHHPPVRLETSQAGLAGDPRPPRHHDRAVRHRHRRLQHPAILGARTYPGAEHAAACNRPGRCSSRYGR